METNYGNLQVQSLGVLEAQRAAERTAAEPDTVEAAEKFEEMFATMLVKELRRGLNEGFFGEGPGAGVFEGWLDRIVGEALVRGKGLGVADMVERSIAPTTPTSSEGESK